MHRSITEYVWYNGYNGEIVKKVTMTVENLRIGIVFSNYSEISYRPSIDIMDFNSLKNKSLWLHDYSVRQLALYGLAKSDMSNGQKLLLSFCHNNELTNYIFNNDYIQKTFLEIYVVADGI